MQIFLDLWVPEWAVWAAGAAVALPLYLAFGAAVSGLMARGDSESFRRNSGPVYAMIALTWPAALAVILLLLLADWTFQVCLLLSAPLVAVWRLAAGEGRRHAADLGADEGPH